ncbi:hypothetical protein D3C86_1670930 [compost metagenome]
MALPCWLFLFVDRFAAKLRIRRRDDHSIACRFQCIKQVVCEAESLVEPGVGRGDVDQQLLIRLEMFAFLHFATSEKKLLRATD